MEKSQVDGDKTLWVAITKTTAAKFYGLLMSLISLVITAKLLGAEGRGIIAAVLGWVGLVSTLGSFSLCKISLHRATHSHGLDWLSVTFSSMLVFCLAISCIGWVIVANFYYFTQGTVFGEIKLVTLMLGFLLLPLTIWGQYQQALLTAIDKLNIYNRALIVGSTAHIILLFIFIVSFGWGVEGALLATILSQLVIATAGLKTLWQQAGKKINCSLQDIKAMLKDGTKLHLNTVGNSIRSQSDILMLNYYMTSADVGVYQLGSRLADILLVIPQSVSMVFYSGMTKSSPNKFWQKQKTYLLKILLIMILICGIVYIISPYIVPILVGEEFRESVIVLQWLLPVVIGKTFGTLMSNQAIGRGYFWQASILGILFAVTNIVLNALWILDYGIMGAIYATLISYALIPIIVNGAYFIWYNYKSGKVIVR